MSIPLYIALIVQKPGAVHHKQAYPPPLPPQLTHDVRNKLNIIIGFAELLLAREVDGEMRHGLDQILSAALKMVEMLK